MPLPVTTVAYLALFASVGFLFVFACLVLGKFLRPNAPTVQKLETYECGEPSIGSGMVQFDLRFYVVALLFLIFEVEVVLFFPPATIFGQANQVRVAEQTVQAKAVGAADEAAIAPSRRSTCAGAVDCDPKTARTLALVAMIDMAVFFAVLLVGFAYLWRRGDLDWVRAVKHPTTPGETAALAARLHRGD